MSYDPHEHIPTGRQVLAAWAACIAVIGLALAVTAERHGLAPAAAAAGPVSVAAAADPCPTAGLRNPSFALCRSDPARRSSGFAQRDRESLSLAVSRCG